MLKVVSIGCIIIGLFDLSVHMKYCMQDKTRRNIPRELRPRLPASSRRNKCVAKGNGERAAGTSIKPPTSSTTHGNYGRSAVVRACTVSVPIRNAAYLLVFIVQIRYTEMCLQKYLIEKFKNWKPAAPEVVNRTKGAISLSWNRLEPFSFLADDFLYNIEKNNKIPKWIVVYTGGKTSKVIDNLAPRHPHRFRLKVILKASAVPSVADEAIAFYKDESAIYNVFNEQDSRKEINEIVAIDVNSKRGCKRSVLNDEDSTRNISKQTVDIKEMTTIHIDLHSEVAGNTRSTGSAAVHNYGDAEKWIESLWSEETWTNTDTDGTSALCFSMAVRCGYLKQVQGMLEERQDLIGAINSSTGFTPLGTAVRKGSISMVRFLVSFGADVSETSSTGQTPLHLAVLSGNITISEFLLDKGANYLDRDWNGLRVEHYAVDSCSLDMIKFVLNRGGDVAVEDNNGWTPLFRAICQEADTEIIEELVKRGSDVDVKDRSGLPLVSVAKLLQNKHGRARESILRLVDSNYPHEKALANFTRLTKKVHNVQSLLKIP